jgi:hypothetical protein
MCGATVVAGTHMCAFLANKRASQRAAERRRDAACKVWRHRRTDTASCPDMLQAATRACSYLSGHVLDILCCNGAIQTCNARKVPPRVGTKQYTRHALSRWLMRLVSGMEMPGGSQSV